MPSVGFHIYVILFNILNSIVSGSMVLLLMFQPQPDRKSRAYLYVELPFLISSIATAVLNLFELVGWDIKALYDVVAVCYLGLGFLYFSFAVEATNGWNRRHYWIRRLLMLDLLLGIGFVLTDHFSQSIGTNTQGYLNVVLNPLSVGLFVVPVWLSTTYASGLLVWSTHKRHLALSPKIVWGVVFISLALMFSIQTPVFRIIGGPFITIGLLLLIRPILRENVFDPITRLNQQLTAITRVGQVANSLMSVDKLTTTVVDEVKRGLSYDGAQIFLVADITEHAAMPEVVRKALQSGAVMCGCATEIAVPLTIAGKPDRELIGIFYLSTQLPNMFDDNTVKVVEILANQVAVAFHNARLFEETRAANEAKTRFIGYISHEIRNAIGTIFSTTQTIIEHRYIYPHPLPSEYVEDLERIYRQSQHVRTLIDDLLDMSRIEAGALQLSVKALNPLPLLKELPTLWMAQLKPNVTFQTWFADALPDVYADNMRLNQILTNLVSNAVKFTEKGSITLAAAVEDQFMRFTVRDTGQGMSEHVLRHLFQPYMQDPDEAHQSRRGTGLGLTITKRLIEQQGGLIQVTSRLGEGTTVSFTLPLAQNCAAIN